MKKLVLLALLPLLLISAVNAMRFRAYIFYEEQCEECKVIQEELTNLEAVDGLRLKVDYGNRDSALYRKQLERCGMANIEVSEPVLIIEEVCVIGADNIRDFIVKLREGGIQTLEEQSLLNAGVLSANDRQEQDLNTTPLPVVAGGVSAAEAKKNTLTFIGLMTLAMIALVLLGYGLGGKKKKVGGLGVVLLVSLLAPLAFSIKASAFCPVCTVAVGAGLGFAKYLGIDDLISGLWIGGLLLSTSLWIINWLQQRKWKFKGYKIVTFALMYGLVIIPFASGGTIGAGYNKFWGIDKVILGMTLGTLGFIAGMYFSKLLIKKNKGVVLFPFQKVVTPITVLILLSLFFYFLVY